MILPIVEFDEKILRQRNYAVQEPLPIGELQTLVQNMFETLDNAGGYGLAAPQVNRSERLFIFDNDKRRLVFINPLITRHWGKTVHADVSV